MKFMIEGLKFPTYYDISLDYAVKSSYPPRQPVAPLLSNGIGVKTASELDFDGKITGQYWRGRGDGCDAALLQIRETGSGER